MMRWTPEAIGKLVDLLDAGRTYAEVANALGCSVNSVSGRISRIRESNRDSLPPQYRFADPAKRNHRRSPSHNFVQTIERLPARVDRDPCFSCGTRLDAPADMGCARCRHLRTLVA
jgi:hypothetical protein